MFSKATTVPFLSLSEDMQMMVYQKMTNSELIRLASKSAEAKKIISGNSHRLSVRPQFGDDVMLMAIMGGIHINCHGRFKDYLKVDENISQRLAGISISSLKINILDQSQITNILNFLKSWRPVCNEVEVFGRLPSEHILEMAECVRVTKSIKITCPDEDYKDMVPVLSQADYCRLINITFESRDLVSPAAKSLEGTDVFEQLKKFREFTINATVPTVAKFFWDLKNATDIGNFKEATFAIPFPEEYEHFPYLFWNKRIPSTEILYSSTRGMGLTLLSIEKLRLQNGMCAMFQVLDKNPKMVINFVIMKEDKEETKKFANGCLARLAIRKPRSLLSLA